MKVDDREEASAIAPRTERKMRSSEGSNKKVIRPRECKAIECDRRIKAGSKGTSV
ncbi:hypothetical protein ACLOJK_028386 [Asimina triloba]